MPLPLVTCLLVLGCVVAGVNQAAGEGIVAVATVIQFFLPTYSTDQSAVIPDGTPDPDTYSL